MSTTYNISPEYRHQEIVTSDWKIKHPEFEYPSDMVKWIDSINRGFQFMIKYEPFELYRLQAQQWLEDESNILDYDTEADQEDWLRNELRRCEENTLYFCNKYGKIKEDKALDGTGAIHYTAWDAQEVLLFLLDCGYSLLIGKGRQIGFTTSLCLAGMKKVTLTKSYFLKFITHSKDKGIEIFRDKVKWAYEKLPPYLAKDVKNWTDQVMSFETKGERKGRSDASGQRFQVDAPSITAINGGSPSSVFVDEIGLMEIAGEMMAEARPAMFKFNPETGKMVMQQQFFGWGTAGDMSGGGAVFESMFRECLKHWREKNYQFGIIPLFFNAYARRGVDAKFIAQEKAVAESFKNTPKGEEKIVQFYQAYPITIDDMFIRKAKTLVPLTKIQERLSKIYSDVPIEYGYFEPIMDKSQPTPDLFTPYRIIGARWVKCDVDHVSMSAMVIHHPPENEIWKNRYYQGTDPINSESGHSKMSSAIWDSLANCVSSVVFYRDKKPKEAYLQVLLQKLYYDQCKEGGAWELLENNIGDGHLDFQEIHGFKRRFTPTAALPEYLQTNTDKWWGISKKTNTAPRIIAKLEDLIEGFGDSIDCPWFWEQLKTFVEKDVKSTTNTQRQTRFSAADLRYDYDDVIDSITYAYINAISFARKEPVNIKEEGLQKKITKRYVMSAETGWRKKLCDVDSNGKVVRVVGN